MKGGNRILVSGERGFLLSNCIGELEGEIIPYEFNRQYENIDTVIHFASPNDRYEFSDKLSMSFSMVDYSISILKQATNNRAKFIFASSVAAEHPQDYYGIYKRFFEQYIESRTNNYLIYRIPRVYGSDRKKGLMKRIRLGDIKPTDWGNEIQYIDIQDFRKWFMVDFGKIGTVDYVGEYHTENIRRIKEIYIKEDQ